MDDFLGKVRKATKSLGKAPFDDEATRKAMDEATKKLYEQYEELIKAHDGRRIKEETDKQE